jgi:hypothetical protein
MGDLLYRFNRLSVVGFNYRLFRRWIGRYEGRYQLGGIAWLRYQQPEYAVFYFAIFSFDRLLLPNDNPVRSLCPVLANNKNNNGNHANNNQRLPLFKPLLPHYP